MATAQKTSTGQAWTLDPEKIVPQRRLQRALREPEILDEFLADPKEVAGRYDVSLEDEEIKAIQNAGRFLASWDLFCGNGQWLEHTRFDGRISASAPTMAETTVEAVRERIADEILQDLPRTLHRVVSEIGSDVLVDPQEKIDELPEHLRPLARTLRRFARAMARGVTRQLSQTSTYGAGQQQQPFQGGQPPYGGMQQPAVGISRSMIMEQGPVSGYGNGGGGSSLGQALAYYLQEVVNDATQEAMDHIRPDIARSKPRWRQGSPTYQHGNEAVR